jgi:membrane-associated phospholipid phosphatase
MLGESACRRWVAVVAATVFFGGLAPIAALAGDRDGPQNPMPRTSRLYDIPPILLPPSDPRNGDAPVSWQSQLNPDFEESSRFYPEQVNEGAVRLLKQLGHDYSAQLTFPFRYARRNPRGIVIGALGFATLVLSDRVTHEALVPEDLIERNNITQRANQLTRMGDTGSSYPLVAGFLAFGVLARSPRERETGVMLCEALVTASTWTFLLKKATGRERPRETDGDAGDWTGPAGIFDDDETRGAEPRSFPSGHATGIWAVATILAHQYPGRKIVPTLAYGTATAMCYSRMVVDAHWLSDVVIGGLIGYGCAKQVLLAHEARRSADEIGRSTTDGPRFHFGAVVTTAYKGVSVSYDF